jgi:phospholipase/carboxylesterase
MSEGIERAKFGDWDVKVRQPVQRDGPQVVLLLHGWTGDENSMWVFERLLPSNALVIAPRAPYESRGTDLGGYSWVDQSIQFLPTAREFLPSVYGLKQLLEDVMAAYSVNIESNLSVVGFSQGAAMAIAFATEFPALVSKLAVLAGFLPDQLDEISKNDADYSVYIGHGSEDDVLPLENAERARSYFESRGVKVTYCVSPVGHRLGTECATGLNDFLKLS